MREHAAPPLPANTAYDMERAIASWRARLSATGRLTRSDVDELESHLRDHVDALAEVGITGDDAFDTAEKRLGEVNALALEYGKVNTMLAWQRPLLWMATGCLATLLGTPTLFVIDDLSGLITARVDIAPNVVTVVAWSMMLIGPALFFGGLFVLPRVAQRASRMLERPAARVLLLTVASTVGLLAYALRYPINRALWQSGEYWLRPGHAAGARATMEGMHVLGIGVPVVLAASGLFFALRSQRVGGGAGSRAWGFMLLGALSAVAGQEISWSVMNASVLGGVRLGLGESSITALTWSITLLLPSVMFGSAHAWLHKAAPSPEQVLRSAPFLCLLLLVGAVGVICTRWGNVPYHHLDHAITRGEFINVLNSWNQARMVATAVAPVTIGAVVLRARHMAQRAMSS